MRVESRELQHDEHTKEKKSRNERTVISDSGREGRRN